MVNIKTVQITGLIFGFLLISFGWHWSLKIIGLAMIVVSVGCIATWALEYLSEKIESTGSEKE